MDEHEEWEWNETGYMCIPEAWTFGSRNEHKYWPRVLWVQGFHHFHIFYVLYCFVIFKTASMQRPASAMIRDWCLSSDKIMVVFSTLLCAAREFWSLSSGGWGGCGGQIDGRCQDLQSVLTILAAVFANTFLKANKKLKPQVNISYDCRSALTESGVKCDLRKDTVCMMYIDVLWCIGRKVLDLRDLLLASSCHQRLVICQHFSC